MRSTLALGVSALFMGVALFATFSNDSVAGKAMGQPEVSTTQSLEPTSETSLTPSSTPTPTESTETVSEPVVTTPSIITSTSTPEPEIIQEDDPRFDCRVMGNRVCGVRDEAGTLHLVCHNANGMPVLIVSDPRNCK